jgi:AAT family amino acid transporter
VVTHPGLEQVERTMLRPTTPPEATVQTDPRAAEVLPPRPLGAAWARSALVSLTVVLVLGLSIWWALMDPDWGALAVYGNPANAFIFWTLFAIVCLAFNLESWGFDRLPQPTRGLAFGAISLTIGAGITIGLAQVWSRVDPSFSPERPGSIGYFTGAIFVLFVFLTNVPLATTFEHRPWKTLGLRQPWVGLCEILAGTLLSIALYAIFAAPALASWSATDEPLLSVNTTVGFFYCVVVSIIITSNHTQGWPWAGEERGPVAWWTSRAVGNVLFGTALYMGLGFLSGLLLGSDAVDALGPDGMSIFPAQFGVWWVFWSIFWSNCTGNRPNGYTTGVNRALRVGITFVLACLSFMAYYHWIASGVLHEPPVAAGMSGNALGFVDWLIVCLLLYVVGAQSWRPARRPAQPTPAETKEESIL